MIAGWIQALCAVLDTPAVPWHQVASALTTLEYVVHMYVLQRQAPLYERTQLPPALAPFVNARAFAARARAPVNPITQHRLEPLLFIVHRHHHT